MVRHLILRLDAPLMSFGGETIDANGVVRDFPARSMIAGLLGNALGYERYEGDRLTRLQERLVCGAVRVREGVHVVDFQTANLGIGDKGWTTRGKVEGRAGGAGTYRAPHIRYRHADANALVLVALRLEPADESPTLDMLAAALDRPERPLFIGRKPFLPSRPLLRTSVDAEDVLGALHAALGDLDGIPDADETRARAQWPEGEGQHNESLVVTIADERDFVVGVHTGQRRVVEGWLAIPQ